jgi:hypothetical protein
MADVLTLEDFKPKYTFSGDLYCVACKHKWEGSVTVAHDDMPYDVECPECHLRMGCFLNPVIPQGPRFVCNCGNDLYYFCEDGMKQCAKCGMVSEIE